MLINWFLLSISACFNISNQYEYVDKKWSDVYVQNLTHPTEIKIQCFQYRILHRILPCNNWLKQIKIKDTNICNDCNQIDNIQHFLLYCHKIKYWFWLSFNNWWNRTQDNHPIITEKNELYILFGFPGGTED
jgi:hypothetical protein